MSSASPESLVSRRQSARILRQSRVPVYVDNDRSPIRKRKYTTNVRRTPEKKEARSTTMTKEELYVAEKELLARRRVELLDEEGKLMKKASPLKRRRVDAEAVQTEEENGVVLSESAKKENVAKSDDGVKAENGAVGVVGNVGEKSYYAKVKETLRVFNKHYLNFVQEEEKRCRKEVVDRKSPKSPEKLEKGSAKMDSSRKSPKSLEKDLKGNAKDGSKKSLKKADAKTKSKKEGVSVTKEVTKKMAKRPDLKAITKMMDSKAVLNPDKTIGEVPGLKVGHQFYSRAEMVVLGFHGHWLSGIDFMGAKYKKVKEFETYQFPFAVSIVLSGMYEDDLDNADEVVYTGSGGHNLNGDKRQIKDQELSRGNLALKNCIANDTPIRVTRGHENKSSYTGRVYTYDGLYKVTKYWADKGISGFTVYKYLLRRVPGQPILTTNQVQFAFGQVPQSISELRGLVCEDIAGGQENFPIPATNLVDDPPVPPTGFKYISSLKVPKGIKIPAAASGCSCKGSCMDPTTCACAKLNGFDFPYVQRDGGRLIEAKDVVYECGPKCGCGPNCINRVSQGGLKFRLEVFRAPRKGWAVRSWDFIPAGAPVCEYIGVLRKSDDVESSWEENNYIFDIDCLQTMGGLGGREKRCGDVCSETTGQTDSNHEQQPEFCIDAGSAGNIARFINHSCEPNLFVQCVLSSHQDMKLARVMLFAADNIPPLQELVYDYGYALDSVLGPDGKVKQMICYCGAADCRKRLL